MARTLVFGNGELHVGLNEYAEVADVYFPYIGLEQHAATPRLAHKLGVWVDGVFSWLSDGSWQLSHAYHPGACVGDTTARSEKLQLTLELTDAVPTHSSAFVRNIHVVNRSPKQRQIRVFFHQAFDISQSRMLETCSYDPSNNAVIHYKDDRIFFVSAQHNNTPFRDVSVGLSGQYGYEGTFRDAEDGQLEQTTHALGRVDSTIQLTANIAAHSSTRMYYWFAAGTYREEARDLHHTIAEQGVQQVLSETARRSHQWLQPALKPFAFAERRHAQSALCVIAAHQDRRGAVLASLDSSPLAYSDAAYAYSWPRDAAYSMWPLLRLGYVDEVRRYFAFAEAVLHPDGYLEHLYLADGAVGPTWYGLCDDAKQPRLAFQADETALTLFLAGQYFEQRQDHRWLNDHYWSFVRPMAAFLAMYTDDDGLPLPSYPLWEQGYMVSTYTTAVTYAALVQASKLARAFGRRDDAAAWKVAAERLVSHAGVLYNNERHFFYAGYTIVDGKRVFDTTLDTASLYGAFMFGLFDVESDEIRHSIETAERALQSATIPGAYVRFEGDDYLQKTETSNVWTVPSLWMAQIYTERDELDKARRSLDWVMSLLDNSPMIPEQVRPDTGESVFVSPLVWSHAELLSTLIDLMQTTEQRL